MDIVIKQTSNEPIYTQIFSQISSQIISGKLKPGEKLPAIRQISNQLRISVIPVKMAWEELDRQGFIKTVTGSGTFVNSLKETEIKEKLDEKTLLLAEKTCREARQNGISKKNLIASIENLWNNL